MMLLALKAEVNGHNASDSVEFHSTTHNCMSVCVPGPQDVVDRHKFATDLNALCFRPSDAAVEADFGVHGFQITHFVFAEYTLPFPILVILALLDLVFDPFDGD